LRTFDTFLAKSAFEYVLVGSFGRVDADVVVDPYLLTDDGLALFGLELPPFPPVVSQLYPLPTSAYSSLVALSFTHSVEVPSSSFCSAVPVN